MAGKRHERRSRTGLYRHTLIGTEYSADQRKHIQAHNFDVVSVAAERLFQTTWKQEGDYVLPLPDLWYNEMSPAEEGRFELRLSIFGRSMTFVTMRIHDTYQDTVASKRRWSFIVPSRSSSHWTEIVSSLSTGIGFEGNGYGSVLLSLSNKVIEKLMDEIILPDIEEWPEEIKNKIVVYAVISDTAQAQESFTKSGRNDVAKKREKWTSNLTSALLPNYIDLDTFLKQCEIDDLKSRNKSTTFVARYHPRDPR